MFEALKKTITDRIESVNKHISYMKFNGTGQPTYHGACAKEVEDLTWFLEKLDEEETRIYLPTSLHSNYLIDIDGTITDDISNEDVELMSSCVPKPGSLRSINALYDAGHTITFFTSRTEEMKDMTLTWLHQWGFKFHGLIMDKPRGGNYIWIDNLDVTGIKYKENYWTDGMSEIEYTLEIQGWTLECEHPLEIRHQDGSFASGQAALTVIESFPTSRKLNKRLNSSSRQI